MHFRQTHSFQKGMETDRIAYELSYSCVFKNSTFQFLCTNRYVLVYIKWIFRTIYSKHGSSKSRTFANCFTSTRWSGGKIILIHPIKGSRMRFFSPIPSHRLLSSAPVVFFCLWCPICTKNNTTLYCHITD